MSTSVLAALQNAELNFTTLGENGGNDNPIFRIALDQLRNAIKALENDLEAGDVIQGDGYGGIVTTK